MHTNEPTPIKDRAGNVVGSIETLENGDQVLRNAQNEVRGYYEAEELLPPRLAAILDWARQTLEE